MEKESTPVPGDDSIMLGATHHHPPTPQLLTMKDEGVLWQKSAFSKNVLGWSPKPIQQKNYQVDSNNNNMGESNMIKEKVINNP